MDSNRWQQWALALAGAWIIISPWVLGMAAPGATTGAAADMVLWGHIAIGLVVAALAIAAIMTFRVWEEWIMLLLGIATIAMPWVLGYTGHVTLTGSDVVAGLVVTALAGWSAFAETTSI